MEISKIFLDFLQMICYDVDMAEYIESYYDLKTKKICDSGYGYR